ncbi:hypothetical protein F5148DRAFT_741497 [Russula earlei]|uniref:Uncharacterized protein n=1 Tax=Russula earlei TaxID=71964 RepID=A0ACC0UCV4_9AGAM|nr:hypothetical protein F5148DRAFT_741497 [Russula earlei]
MSRSSTAATSRYPSQLPSKSAWARGPPQQNSSTTIPRAQSPVPPTPVSSPTYPLWFGHSPPSTFGTFGQEVPTKDGVSIPRNPAKKVITHFGSVSILNDKPDSAESVSPPTSTPPPAPKNDKPDFAESVSPPTSTPPPAPKFDKKALEKLFQGPSTHRVSDPSLRWLLLPHDLLPHLPNPVRVSRTSLGSPLILYAKVITVILWPHGHPYIYVQWRTAKTITSASAVGHKLVLAMVSRLLQLCLVRG